MAERLGVIIPIHNGEQHLPQLLRGLSRAVDDRTDVVIVDDGSTDATARILDQAEVDFSLDVVRHRQPRGVSAARNTGLRQTRSTYLTFLDSDDTFDQHHLRTLRDVLDATGVDMVRTDHLEVRGKERTVRRVPDSHRGGRVGDPREAICPAFVRTAVDHPNVWAGAFHRRLLDRGVGWMREDLRTAEDRVWTWDMFLHAHTFTISPRIGVHYRRDVGGSLSRVADERQLDFIRALDAIIDLLAVDPDGERFLPKAIQRSCELLLHHLSNTRLPGPLQRTFQAMAAEHFRSLPAEPRDRVIAGLLPDRRARIERVIA
ncbi:glycosyltransferase family 2 protein [Propioniferax innocua]|uniref:Glycosyl transferase family 2 n=1 Tax=Propioniferax innocua TaxID=1753 RepID=A0A542ZQ00_9ACTN|nr:glycosyltransferase family 2 protein [Propioniferax innocua]TQL62432.1 glycosyl transferase family 2 [Propioniferax innocua]